MAANRIKGITIEIDTSQVNEAIQVLWAHLVVGIFVQPFGVN